jgi:hypothetical protein
MLFRWLGTCGATGDCSKLAKLAPLDTLRQRVDCNILMLPMACTCALEHGATAPRNSDARRKALGSLYDLPFDTVVGVISFAKGPLS